MPKLIHITTAELLPEEVPEAVQIELTAANLATLVDEGGMAWLGHAARYGWALHAAGRSPRPWLGPSHMAGWLARQIWCHGRGDDSEHVEVIGG